MKTKLGISVGLMGAAIYFMGIFGGYLSLILLVGYVLLFEQNEWLRKNAVKAFVLAIVFSILNALVGLIPNIADTITKFMAMFGKYVSKSFISNFTSILYNIIGILDITIFLVLGIKSLKQGSIKMEKVDKLVEQHMTNE